MRCVRIVVLQTMAQKQLNGITVLPCFTVDSSDSEEDAGGFGEHGFKSEMEDDDQADSQQFRQFFQSEQADDSNNSQFHGFEDSEIPAWVVDNFEDQDLKTGFSFNPTVFVNIRRPSKVTSAKQPPVKATPPNLMEESDSSSDKLTSAKQPPVEATLPNLKAVNIKKVSKRNVLPNLGQDDPARQEKSPRVSVIKPPLPLPPFEASLPNLKAVNIKKVSKRNAEPNLGLDDPARQEKSPRELPSTPQSRDEVTEKKSVEDAGDGRVEDLEMRDDDECGLTIMSVESVIRTPSLVSSISRPSVIVDNPSPRTSADRKITRQLLQDRSSCSPIINPPGRPDSEKEPLVITIDDNEDQDVKKESIVTAQDDGDGEEEDQTPAIHKRYRELLSKLPPSISVFIRGATP